MNIKYNTFDNRTGEDPKQLQKYIKFILERKGNTFSISHSVLPASPVEYNFPIESSTQISDENYLHFWVGNAHRTKKDVKLQWESFAINSGKVLLP